MGNLIASLAGMLFLLLIFSVIGLIMYQLSKRNMKWTKVVAVGTVCLAAYFLLTFSSLEKSTNMSLKDFALSSLDASVAKVLVEAEKSNAKQSDIEDFRKQVDYTKTKLIPFLVKIFPAMMLVGALFLAFTIYMIVRYLVTKKHDTYDSMPVFDNWYLNEQVMWVFIAGIAAVAAKKILGDGLIFDVGMNIVVFLANIYFLVGLAIMMFWLHKRKAPRLMQFLLLFLILVWPFLTVMVLVIGTLDTWMNFRKITKGGKIWK